MNPPTRVYPGNIGILQEINAGLMKSSKSLFENTMTTIVEPEHTFEFVNESVMVRTMEGKIHSWNRSAAELYGWRKEEAIGRISHELLQTRFPKPLEEIESELVRNRLWEGKLVHTTRDGGRMVVKSRWALDSNGDSEAVVEINAPSNDPDNDLNRRQRLRIF